jgi:hypothetical protein
MELFYKEFPPKVPIGFIIMRFGSEPEHVAIIDALKRASIRCGVTLIRADHRMYHEDLMENVRVYLHGCSFGIAIFEDAESKGFNPNVSLEVGYLQALGKPVLPLKSPTLPRLPTDLLSKLYLDYEPIAIHESTILQISHWIAQRIQIKRVSDRLSMELPPFDGHSIVAKKGVRNGKDQAAVSGGIQTANHRFGERGKQAFRSRKAVWLFDPKYQPLGGTGRTGSRIALARQGGIDDGGARGVSPPAP